MKQQQPPQQPLPPEEPPREVIVDAFQKIKKDPRINTAIRKEQRPRQTETSQNKSSLLSSAADAVSRLSIKFGLPSFLSSYKQVQQVNWALLHPEDTANTTDDTTTKTNFSVIYSNRGETYGRGRTTIDNQLFFEKTFPQHTVWSYDAFIDHHMNHAADSERFILLDSQVLSTAADFSLLLDQQITRLIFERPLSTGFKEEISLQRQNILTKYPSLKFPHTNEGLRDFVFLIRSIQLIHGSIFRDLRERSIPAVLNALRSHTIFDAKALNQMAQDYSASTTPASPRT